MPVVASDLVCYASANMPVDDSATSGGAIDALRRVVFTQMASSDTVKAVSSSASDTTQTVTVTGRRTDGSVANEVKTLTGTTPITFSTLGTVDRVLKVEMSATAVGTITISTTGAVTLGTIPIGERGFMAFHQQATSSPSSGVTDYYKVFIKNTGASTLTSGSVSEVSDSSGRLDFAVAATVNDTASVANRITAPGGLSFSSSGQSIPASLTPADAIGVWIRATHPAGDSAHNLTLTMGVSGTP
jgi:hypothetical protein